LIAKSTERESRKLDYRETVEVRGKTTTYLWYNGSTSCNGGERVEKTEVKAKKDERSEDPHIRDPKRSELPMSKLKCQ